MTVNNNPLVKNSFEPYCFYYINQYICKINQ
jgi:hypothetical protein